MSRTPTGTVVPSMRSIAAARRLARSSPRAAIPTSTTSAAPLFRSRISWAIRVTARRISVASRRRVVASDGIRPPSLREAGQKERPTAWRWSARRAQPILPSRPHGTGLKGEALSSQNTNTEAQNGTCAAGVPFEAGTKGAYVMAFLQGIGAPELIIILVIVLLLFGAKKLPEMARSLGKSQREFKKGIREGADEENEKPAPH